MSDQGVSIRHLLIEALQLAASGAGVQISSLPSYVNVADEVAETYAHPYYFLDTLVTEKLVTSEQLRALRELDQLFAQMTQNKGLWTVSSLQSAPEWQEVRIRAQQLLASMGQPVRRPNLSGTSYVPLDLQSN